MHSTARKKLVLPCLEGGRIGCLVKRCLSAIPQVLCWLPHLILHSRKWRRKQIKHREIKQLVWCHITLRLWAPGALGSSVPNLSASPKHRFPVSMLTLLVASRCRRGNWNVFNCENLNPYPLPTPYRTFTHALLSSHTSTYTQHPPVHTHTGDSSWGCDKGMVSLDCVGCRCFVQKAKS